MRQMDEQQITAMAPNANAVANARKISRGGGFIKLEHSADDTYYAGSCKGSGSSVYGVSVDFCPDGAPVCRCSCPSRQFPCKHALALLMEMGQGRQWEICEIPRDILDKRARKEAREHPASEGKAPEKAVKRTGKAARTKKIKKQLEGLELAERMVRELVESGLGTLRGTPAKVYQDLAKQLGDYYLPGPQRLIQSLVLNIQSMEEGGDTASEQERFREAVHILVYLRALVKKARAYLEEKLSQDQVSDDDSVLYEELGGIWTLERLRELGLKKEGARLVQLAFSVYCDTARKEMVDKGWWIDVDSGEISVTYNYRPLRALKYMKAEDSIFQMAEIPMLTYYPGGGNRRVRWEEQSFSPVTEEIRQAVCERAGYSLKEAVKGAKNELKNTLSDGRVGCLIQFERLGRAGDRPVLTDREGSVIELRDRPGNEGTVSRLEILPDPALCLNRVMFGFLWYDGTEQRICMQPLAIISREEILRLLY